MSETAVPAQGVAALHAKIRSSILTGELSAGQIVSQVQLAESLGVSRTPLREALRLLEREGLVEAEHNKRIRIAPYDIDDLEQIYAMRISLESLAARFSVPGLTAADLEIMVDACDQMTFYGEREDYETWEKFHGVFHSRIVCHSGARFVRTLSQLYDHSLRYRRLTTTQQPRAWSTGDTEHRAILQAAIAHDVPAVAEGLARHYARVALNAVALTAPEHDPRHVREALRTVLALESSAAQRF